MGARFRGHLLENGKNRKHYWIRELKRFGIVPRIEIVEIVLRSDDFDWQPRERFWIGRFKADGHDLTNLDTGGRGGNRRSEETKKKCSIGHLGIILSAESIEKMRKSQIERLKNPAVKLALRMAVLGKKQTPDMIAKRSAGMKGHVVSQETREKLRAKFIGRFVSEETKAKIRAARAKQIITPEHRANLSKAIKGRKPSPQTIAASVARCKGIPLTEEFKAKLRASAKRRWQRVRDLERGQLCPP